MNPLYNLVNEITYYFNKEGKLKFGHYVQANDLKDFEFSQIVASSSKKRLTAYFSPVGGPYYKLEFRLTEEELSYLEETGKEIQQVYTFSADQFIDALAAYNNIFEYLDSIALN